MAMKTPFDSSWLNIIDLSNSLLDCVLQADWDKTEKLSKERHEKIEQHFLSFPISPDNILKNQEKMIEFTRIEGKINNVITQEKKKLTEKSALIKNQRVGVNAYGLSQT